LELAKEIIETEDGYGVSHDLNANKIIKILEGE